MKTTKKCTILYTEYGDYLEIKTPLTTPLLGQVIEVDLPIRKAFSPRFLKIASIAAMLLLVLGISVFNIVSGANTAVAAVVMDINHSKELLVNSDDKVLRVIDINQGTQTSHSELKLRGKDIYTSVALMIDQANTQGIFKQSKNLIMASIIPLDNRQVDVVDQAKLRDSISRHMLEENISADLMVSKTDETTQKTAQSLGMSVNHYLVYRHLKDKGFAVKPNGSSTTDILHLLTEANTTLNSLFPNESMTINPQSETRQAKPNSMGTPMTGTGTGKNMPSNASHKSDARSSLSFSNMTNPLPPSSDSVPSNSPMNGTPSVSTPKPDNMPASSGSGSHNMMP